MSIEHGVVDQSRIVRLGGWSIGLLTVDQFCQFYNVKRTKLYELLNSGALIARTIDGSMTRIRPADAEAWAEGLGIWQPDRSKGKAPDT